MVLKRLRHKLQEAIMTEQSVKASPGSRLDYQNKLKDQLNRIIRLSETARDIGRYAHSSGFDVNSLVRVINTIQDKAEEAKLVSQKVWEMSVNKEAGKDG